MPELIVGGIALSPIIVALVELAKRYGNLSTEHAPLLNGLLTVGALAFVVFIQNNPTHTDIATLAIYGVTLFLGNAGLYVMAVKPYTEKRELEEMLTTAQPITYSDTWVDSGIEDGEILGNDDPV